MINQPSVLKNVDWPFRPDELYAKYLFTTTLQFSPPPLVCFSGKGWLSGRITTPPLSDPGECPCCSVSDPGRRPLPVLCVSRQTRYEDERVLGHDYHRVKQCEKPQRNIWPTGMQNTVFETGFFPPSHPLHVLKLAGMWEVRFKTFRVCSLWSLLVHTWSFYNLPMPWKFSAAGKIETLQSSINASFLSHLFRNLLDSAVAHW